MKRITKIQNKIENKLRAFKNLNEQHILISILGFTCTQTIYQYFTYERPIDKTIEIGFLNDPVFYLSLTLILLIMLLILRKSKRS